ETLYQLSYTPADERRLSRRENFSASILVAQSTGCQPTLSVRGLLVVLKLIFSNFLNHRFELLPIDRLSYVVGETSRDAVSNVVFHPVTAYGDAANRITLGEIAH